MRISDNIQIGARWDSELQDSRFLEANELSLVDYVEVNFPISQNENPELIGLPILAHTANNPLCSTYGIDLAIASKVKEGATKWNSPYVGEHLSLLGPYEKGSVGYVINPPFDSKFAEIAIDNTKALSDFYEKQIALELGPAYGIQGDFTNEIDFLNYVAVESKSGIILDLTHLLISNMNLGRKFDYGIDLLQSELVFEIHVAGMRKGKSSNFWYDAHGLIPSDEVINLLKLIIPKFSNLKYITLEHSIEGSSSDFLDALAKIRRAI